MEANEDPLRREMHVERTQRADGRALFLYSWPTPAEAAAEAPVAEPHLEPWSPEAGPADV